MPKNLNLAQIFVLYPLYISVITELLFILVRQEIFLTTSPFTKSPDLGRIILYSERILTTKQVFSSFALANIAVDGSREESFKIYLIKIVNYFKSRKRSKILLSVANLNF